ncbi:hypothetical protein NV379_10540 [Paenibacillus sp. N1-5-1-14]|uniref:hypothetical protein n=1 Tax=Paenibacillus radicibacter TaxID=2972488 RepID=UPI002158CA18|nr:hypothetical protein [Paenibacillus radicibacter]MCR8643096.1 hypothetical protein [Paenibacillus radicibacter]
MYNQRKNTVSSLSVLIPLFFIWGLEWIVRAGLLLAEKKYNVEGWSTYAFYGAVGLSVIAIIVSLMRPSWSASSHITGLFLIPMLLFVLACWILQYIGAVNLFFIPIFQSFLLATGLVALGIMLGRTLTFIGLWLFAMAATLSILYLGYSPLILYASGGIAMFVAAIQLRMWNRF